MNDRKLSAFRNHNIGFVFQFHQLLPEFSLAENVAMPALIGGNKPQIGARAGSKTTRPSPGLPTVLLTGRRNCRAASASGSSSGEGTPINNPPCGICRRAFGQLDSANRASLHRLFFNLRDELGATFVIVTHDEGLAADSDTIVRMADGRIVGIETKSKHI